MQIEQAVTEVLHEAIQALTALDLNKLERLEERFTALAVSSGESPSDRTLAKRRLLGLIRQNCKSNLDALDRLRGGDTRDLWVH
jgi:hypothetical protein